ncbi:MAG TPA: glutathione S-transferase family protein [Sphingobium sp.]
MTRIWGRRGSSSVQKVMWTLAELGVEHERIDAGYGFGLTDSPAYLAKNPNGTIPTLEEPDGFTLWESNAIVRYLATRHGEGTLAPADLRANARANSWMDWASITLEPALSTLWNRLVLKGAPPSTLPDETLIDKVVQNLTLLSASLPPKGFLLGDRLSIGDIPVGQLVSRWFKLPISHPEIPRIQSYFALLGERSAYREHVIAARPLTCTAD